MQIRRYPTCLGGRWHLQIIGSYFTNAGNDVKQTCRRLLDLVSKSTKLQLHIELEANGFEIRDSAAQDGQRAIMLLEKLKVVRDSEFLTFALFIIFLPF